MCVNSFLHTINLNETDFKKYMFTVNDREARGIIVVKALCYKPEGCGFDTR
jgi:hypothetical protein